MKEEKLELGDIGDEGCPCGTYKTKGYEITAHCWRTGQCCQFSGVHYKYKRDFRSQAKAHAMRIRDYIEDAWMTDCALKSDGLIKD